MTMERAYIRRWILMVFSILIRQKCLLNGLKRSATYIASGSGDGQVPDRGNQPPPLGDPPGNKK